MIDRRTQPPFAVALAGALVVLYAGLACAKDAPIPPIRGSSQARKKTLQIEYPPLRARDGSLAEPPPAGETLPAAAPVAAPAPAPVPAPAPAPTPPAAAGGDFNFDLGPGTTVAAPARSGKALQDSLRIERLGKIRRGMLTAHLAVGLVTLAGLAATCVIGQLNYQDKFVSNNPTGKYELAHLGLASGTSGLFAATGALALFAPTPYKKPYRLDSAMVHRVAMGLATAGMLAELVLGPLTQSRVGYLNQSNLALGHLINGYATFAFMATGVVAYVF